MPLGCLPLLFFLWIAFLIPVFFMDALLTAMAKLGFSVETAVFLVFWIFMGGLINIPVKRLEREEMIDFSPVSFFGLNRLYPKTYQRSYTIIAVNVGGCLIPTAIALYEWMRLGRLGGYAIFAALLAVLVNVVVCYRFARPLSGIGIALPPFLPALTAVLCAWLLLPGFAAPVAFIAGVMGPLIGADLLHLKDISRISTGIGSIGGAGTFDGIVLSGLFAVLLA